MRRVILTLENYKRGNMKQCFIENSKVNKSDFFMQDVQEHIVQNENSEKQQNENEKNRHRES